MDKDIRIPSKPMKPKPSEEVKPVTKKIEVATDNGKDKSLPVDEQMQEIYLQRVSKPKWEHKIVGMSERVPSGSFLLGDIQEILFGVVSALMRFDFLDLKVVRTDAKTKKEAEASGEMFRSLLESAYTVSQEFEIPRGVKTEIRAWGDRIFAHVEHPLRGKFDLGIFFNISKLRTFLTELEELAKEPAMASGNGKK